MNLDENKPVPGETPHRSTRKGTLGFRLIGAMKLGSAVLLAAAGFGIFRMLNRDVGEVVERWVTRMHLDPDNTLVHETVSRVSGIDRGHLKALGVGTFFYALLHLVEGTGLILLQHWAEYLTVIATGSLLPLELYEIAQKRTALRFAVLTVNVVVLAYLVVKLRQQRSATENSS